MIASVKFSQPERLRDVLGLETFDEDARYENLDWLAGAQAAIEDRLYAQRHKTKPASLFLYDVTSSYVEGTHNALAAFGYNRDGKKGKMQIVIGLLCDEDGHPVSIEVFPGNTPDPHTLAAQVAKLKARFGVQEITFVGDRGMIKSQQIEDLATQGFHYITAITTHGSPMFRAVQKKWCTALYRALMKNPTTPESAVGAGSEPSYVERAVGVP